VYFLIAYALVALHTPGGGTVEVNPNQVISMRTLRPGEAGDDLLTKKVECVIATSDGKIINVVEECDEVDRLFRKALENGNSKPDGG